jgi:hypothetical protein
MIGRTATCFDRARSSRNEDLTRADASYSINLGASHFIPDKELDRMFNNPYHIPQFEIVNAPDRLPQMQETMMYGAPMTVRFHPLKKPPEQLPKWHRVWQVYELAKQMKEYYESGQQGQQWDRSVYNGLF